MLVIKDNDGINNIANSMQTLAQLSAQRKNRDLQTAELLRSHGKNLEAERLILSSQRGLLRNLFGDPAREWQAQGAFETSQIPNIPLREKQAEQWSADAEQGKLLSQLLNPKSPDYNPDMANLMAQGSPRTLSELSKMNEQGIMNLTNEGIQSQFSPLLEAYKNQEAANKGIRESNAEADLYNAKAERANANKPKFRDTYTGNEVDQHQQLINDTINAIQNNGGLAAYNRYVTTGKAISDHYGHTFQPQSPAFFGIGAGGKGGTGEKPDDVYIKDAEGNAIIPLKLTKTEINDPEIKQKLFNKYQKQLASKGIYSWEDLDIGYASGNSFNLSTDDKMKNKIAKQNEKEKLQNALTMLNQRTGWNVGDAEKGTVIRDDDEARAYIAGLGLEAYQDKDGKWRIKQGRGIAKAQPQNDVDQFLGD